MNPFSRYAALLAMGGGDDFHPDPGMGDFDDLSDLTDQDLDDELIMGGGEYIGGVENQIEKIDRQIVQLQSRARHARNQRQRRRLMERISNLQAKRADLVNKAGRQLARRGDRMSDAEIARFRGRTGLAAAGGAGVGVLGGRLLPGGGVLQDPRPPGYYTGDQDFRDDGLAYQNYVLTQPPAGEGIRIPLLISNAPLATFTFAAGAGSRTQAVTASTPQITFAGFRVYGIETIVQLQPTSEGLVSVTIDTTIVNGGVNLLYASQNASFAGQGGTAGSATGGKATIAGLRQNPILEPNNTATLTATIRQDATNAAAINGTIQFALIVRSVSDNQAGRD
jgi:hypothetical protein